jgi:uncharacterized protein (DUF885 family)
LIGSRVTLTGYGEWRLPFNSDSGFFTELLQLDSLVVPQTAREYEDYIARLNDVPRYFDENIANARSGMRASAIREGFRCFERHPNPRSSTHLPWSDGGGPRANNAVSA